MRLQQWNRAERGNVPKNTRVSATHAPCSVIQDAKCLARPTNAPNHRPWELETAKPIIVQAIAGTQLERKSVAGAAGGGLAGKNMTLGSDAFKPSAEVLLTTFSQLAKSVGWYVQCSGQCAVTLCLVPKISCNVSCVTWSMISAPTRGIFANPKSSSERKSVTNPAGSVNKCSE